MAVSPHSLVGYKTRALIESLFNPLDDKGNEELDSLINELLQAINEKDNTVKEIFYSKDVGEIKNYFISITEKSIGGDMLKMYQEYLLQQKKKDLPISVMSFSKILVLYTIISKLAQDKKIPLNELVHKVHKIIESE